GRVTLHGYSIESKEAGVLHTGKATEAFSDQRDTLVAHQRAVQPRGAAVGEDIGNRLIDRVVGRAVVGLVIALEIDGLRRLMHDDVALRGLLGLDGGHALR